MVKKRHGSPTATTPSTKARPGTKAAAAPAALPPPMVEDRWMEHSLTRRLLPGTVESILVNGLQGDLTDQLALFVTMQDTWPRLQHNVRTLREAVEAAPFTVHPWTDGDGTDTTESAQARAALVERALWGMCPDLTALEWSLEDGLRHLAGGTVQGHAVMEILWHVRPDADGGMAVLPRALRRTGSSYYAYAQSWTGGRTTADRLMFRPDGGRGGSGSLKDFPACQFLTGIFPGHDGHPSVAAPLRALAKYWIAATYGPEWLLNYAQLFGAPMRWATYQDDKAKESVCAMLANLGNCGWGAFPSGTELKLHEAAKSSGDLPQKLIIDLADTAADILVLGQTLSADTGDKGGGSFALGKVHQTVRRERLEACGKAAAKVLTHQLARAVCILNYGDADECPEIRCDLPEPEDEKAKAERDNMLATMGLRLPVGYLYERHGIPEPKEGEATVGGGAAAATPEGQNPDGTPGQLPMDPAAAAALNTLNGAQVTALTEMLNKVASGMVPYDSAVNTALAAFPGIGAELINKIFTPVKNFKLPAPDPVPAPSPDKIPPGDPEADPKKKMPPGLPAKAARAELVPDLFRGDLAAALEYTLLNAAAEGFETGPGNAPTLSEIP